MQSSVWVILPIACSLLRLPSCRSGSAASTAPSEAANARPGASADAGTPKAPAASASAASSAHPPHGQKAAAGAHGRPQANESLTARPPESTKTYAVPFVWDPDSEDPVARARNLLREIATDNTEFKRRHDASYFKTFADTQKPRVTFVTCSDSRVQSTAFDTSPDNDLFTVRNIGNQIKTSSGSVQYGVEHLKTPLLIVAGHTGCGAVKAVLTGHSAKSEAIRRELRTIDLSPIGGKKVTVPTGSHEPAGDNVDSRAWRDAVIINIHHQVATALEVFAEQVSIQDVIVVGILYDFRNDMRLGNGSATIVNVNGHTDIAELGALKRALLSGPRSGYGGGNAEILLGPVPVAGGRRIFEPVPPGGSGQDRPSATTSELEAALAQADSRADGTMTIKASDVPRALRALEELAGIAEPSADAGPPH